MVPAESIPTVVAPDPETRAPLLIVHPPMVPATDVMVPVNAPEVAVIAPVIVAFVAVRAPAAVTANVDPVPELSDAPAKNDFVLPVP